MEGWKEIVLGRLGNTFTGLSGKTKDDFGFGSKYIQYVNIFNNSKIDIGNLELVNVKSNEKQSKVKFGDIFFTTSSETIEEVGMSSVLLDEIKEDIYLNSFCFGFRLFEFDNLLPEYAQHLLRAAHMRHSISMFGKGSTRYNLSKTLLLKDLVLFFPSTLIEQHKIATILNTLDQSIAQTKKLIAKYKNIKQGLMYDLLTYGIDENGIIRNPETHTFVEKKEILVSEEWEKNLVSDFGVIITGSTPDTKNSSYWDGNYPFYSPADFSENIYCSKTEKNITNQGLMTGRIIPQNSVMVTCIGSTIGKLALNSIRGITNQQINSVIVNNNHNYKFVYYLLQNNTTQIRNLASQTAIPIINKTSFSNLEFFAPKSLIEEDKIVSIIEQQDSLIESEQTNLAKLQNIKQGLMSDLLTGKIRVKI